MQAAQKKETENTHDFWLGANEQDKPIHKFRNEGHAVVYDGKYYAMVAAPSAEHPGNRREVGHFSRYDNKEWSIGGRRGAAYHGDRQFDFVITQANNMVIGEKDTVGHTNLSERKMVKFAGTITFLDGDDAKNKSDLNQQNKTTIVMTRGSGHYKTAGLNSQEARQKIAQLWGPGRVGTQGFAWDY
ncbi:hypothetical protein [Pseudoalteromonas luteoviolacea]|uniref:Uncharacterized protein n=1 Tax=Pseudoalteromonas luteoviolacea S4060-1 TaxID=1365257 RepID=A0A167IMG7_9GAMM|nr:hypothetical protein [Pseudoalteromonas luteoviolacea]KZN36519.1 hypothetical protein N480_17620 [Pseudoalteromonas luteoviolacea S2607]KZN59722.1 hypothetical protein N478_08365 [Pseudoalteromonas luteoviolacea S4060-1]